MPLAKNGSDPERLRQLVQDVSFSLFGPFGSRIFRKAVLGTGDVSLIRAYYEGIWRRLFEPEPTIMGFNVEAVPDIAWILRAEGEVERANTLLVAALDVSRTHDWVPMFPSELSVPLHEVEILALLGREDEAMSLLRDIADAGWRFGWWQAESDPALASLRERPDFVAIFDEIRADMARQLASMPEYEPPVASD